MKSLAEIKQLAINTIHAESQSISRLAGYIDNDFGHCVEIIYKGKGRVVVTGIGKSAIIAQKIVATFNSTGTPAIFMHAADAIHGDLGIIQTDDIVICISKSGNTPEIKILAPLIRNFGNVLIALVSNADSFLARRADYVLKATVEKEACPNNLAPTSSTTAQMVIGDALAIALVGCRNFSSSDFARFHPGGSLGKRLYLRVRDLYQDNDAPKVYEDESIKEAIIQISSKILGATAVLDRNEKLVGIITDGDVRRMLETIENISNIKSRDIMSKNPKSIRKNELAIRAFNIMKQNKIMQIIVADGDKYLGMVHLHHILKEGIV